MTAEEIAAKFLPDLIMPVPISHLGSQRISRAKQRDELVVAINALVKEKTPPSYCERCHQYRDGCPAC